MKKHRILAAISANCAVLTGLCMNPAVTTYAAQDPAGSSIVILGDGGSAKPSDGTYGYFDYIAECTGSTITNLAGYGMTTDDLITILNDTSKAETIQTADIICVSIGANDLIQPTISYVNTMRQKDETTKQLIKRLSEEGDVVKLASGLTNALRDPRSHAMENYPIITEKLRSLNPDAKIILQTIYNPFYCYLDVQTEPDERASYGMEYIDGNLNLLNKTMKKQENIEIADVSAVFTGKSWSYCQEMEKEFVPTALGHAWIASIIMNQMGVSSKTSDQMTQLIDKTPAETLKQIPADDLKLIQPYVNTDLSIFIAAPLKGDVSGNGEVDIEDAQLTLNAYVDIMSGKKNTLSAEQIMAADVNGDNAVSIEDAQFILNYYVQNNVADKPTTWEELFLQNNVASKPTTWE